jgi:uncharacterized protein (TIGR02001 family)
VRLVCALVVGGLFYTVDAGAQLSGTAIVVSDYRFRGISLSHEKPAAQASIDYDDPGGWYAGVFGSTVELPGESSTTAQAVAYFGVTTSIGDGFHWDLGANYSAFTDGRDYDYGEVHAGVASQSVNARLHYSPDYFGVARSSFYGEINGTYPLSGGFALLGHVGILVPLGRGGDEYTNAMRNPVDARVGLALTVSGFEVQVAWVGTNGTGALYPIYGMQRRNTVVGSVSRSF